MAHPDTADQFVDAAVAIAASVAAEPAKPMPSDQAPAAPVPAASPSVASVSSDQAASELPPVAEPLAPPILAAIRNAEVADAARYRFPAVSGRPRLPRILPMPRLLRFSPLAATIAIAAAFGAMAGSLTTASVSRLTSRDSEPVVAATPAPDAVTRQTVAKLETELAALKAGLDQSGKASASHFAKLSERFDRAEKARAEPLARLDRLAETLDRMEKRGAPPSQQAAAADVTGSVSPPRTATAAAAAEGRPTVLDGWTLRDVYNGAAMIQGRRMGVIEVIPGDNVPGIGRIETIRRVDGHWVVTTSKGVILGR